MAISIGNSNFINLTGPPLAPIANATEVWHRPGLDGDGIRLLGKSTDPVMLETVGDYALAANAVTGYSTLRAMQGTLQTVTDGLGNVTNSVLIERVAMIAVHRVETPVGGSGGNYLLRCGWQVRPTE
jgi:hypothetical protein